MGKFVTGDKVISNCGQTATVVSTLEYVTVSWDGWPINGTWPVEAFELVERKFRVGQWVRVVSEDEYNGMVGLIFADDGSEEDDMPYEVALFNSDLDEYEDFFSADELEPWLPVAGERVVASDDEDEVGTVLLCVDGYARVLWDEYPKAQNWPVGDLEPADEEEDDEIRVGDEVEYSNPIFTDTARARVSEVNDNVIRVDFEPGTILTDGFYPKDNFQKVA